MIRRRLRALHILEHVCLRSVSCRASKELMESRLGVLSMLQFSVPHATAGIRAKQS